MGQDGPQNFPLHIDLNPFLFFLFPLFQPWATPFVLVLILSNEESQKEAQLEFIYLHNKHLKNERYLTHRTNEAGMEVNILEWSGKSSHKSYAMRGCIFLGTKNGFLECTSAVWQCVLLVFHQPSYHSSLQTLIKQFPSMVQEWHSRGCQCVWTELKSELRCWWCWQETTTRATRVPWWLSSTQTADTCSPHLHGICNLATISKPLLSSLSVSLFRVSCKSGLMWLPFSFLPFVQRACRCSYP